MPTLRSSVLIVGHPEPNTVGFGADFSSTVSEAIDRLKQFRYPVIVIPCQSADAHIELDFLRTLESLSPQTQKVLIRKDLNVSSLQMLLSQATVFRILREFDDTHFEHSIQEALEEHSLVQQNSQLMSLISEQHASLKRLTIELEARVDKRQRHLEESRKKLLQTNAKIETLHRALVAVHRARSVGEMERLVNDALTGTFQLRLTRIAFHSQGQVRINTEALLREFVIFEAPLMSGRDEIGFILFARDAQLEFSKDETLFLNQIAEAVSLAISRLTKVQQLESLKQQWEATFDAIIDPVSIIDENRTLIRINSSYARACGESPEKLIGQKCYKALWNLDSPCEGCSLGRRFRLDPSETRSNHQVTYEVFSQEAETDNSHTPRKEAQHYVHLYHDLTEKIQMEQQMIESAKMAELGTIGSSIAHELNNPLAGMLTFLQLTKLDLAGNEPYYEDIKEMELGTLRCRDIVQNLLGFTRKSKLDEDTLFDLKDVILQAFKITNLQTKALGVEDSCELPDHNAEFSGHFNLLLQAVISILQNSQERLAQQVKQQEHFKPQLKLRLSLQTDGQTPALTTSKKPTMKNWVVEIFDNSPRKSTDSTTSLTSGIGFTVALQIIKDHHGQVEVKNLGKKGASIQIHLPTR